MRRCILIVTAAAAVVLTVLAPTAGADPGTRSAAVHPIRRTTSNQVVVVDAAHVGAADATLTAYRWDYDRWVVALGPYHAYLGPNGFTDEPHEDDGYTPIGQYNFTMTFGTAADPGTAMPYRVVTADDHWVDDPASPLYNTYQRGDANGRWGSAEDLSNYENAAAFDFNQQPVVANGNSAIFLHGGNGPTGGCVAIDQSALLAVLRWLDPATHPQIELGVTVPLPPHPSTPRPSTTTTSATTSTTAPIAIRFPTSLAVSRPPTPQRTPESEALVTAVAGAAALAAGFATHHARRRSRRSGRPRVPGR